MGERRALRRANSGIVLTWLLVGMLTLALAPVNYVNVDVSQAKQMIESNPNLVILDVRTQGEYDSGHIQNATLIPVSELAGRLGELEKDREILVYCAAGGRSATASQTLVDNGFLKVYKMLGGITAWKTAGYRIEIIHNGDLIVDGTQTYIIENCTYVQTGNIYVRDWSQLTISNAILKLCAEYQGQLGLFVEDYANLEIENVSISGFTFWVNNLNHARTRIYNSNMFFEDGCWLGCGEDSVVEIEDSKVGEIIMDQRSRVTVKNSELNSVILNVFSDGPASLQNIKPGLFAFWNLHESEPLCNLSYNLTLTNTLVAGQGWSVFVDCQSAVTVSNSTVCVGISFSHTTAQIRDLRPGFHKMWSHDRIALEDCLLTHCGLFFNVEAYCIVINSTFGYSVRGDANVSVIESSVEYAGYNGGIGTLYSDTTTFGWLSFAESVLFIHGNVEFSPHGEIRRWALSNITRNYNTLAKKPTGDPAENVILTLFDRNSTLVWNGATNSLGQADFNLTFTDSNYTDTLTLEAVKGNLSIVENITFLSDTPIIILIGISGDINGDWTVDIYDAIMLANAYNSGPESPSWNPKADVNSDNVVDIYDAILLASNYGKKA
jgi:rhodanese-related sulfurtransferase